MSIVKFELKEQHVKLLKHLRWSINANNFIIGTEDENEDQAPFNENNIYDACDIILNGVPEDFNPLSEEHENNIGMKAYTPEQMAEWDMLYSELPVALDIVLFNGHFELGLYRTKYHLRDWKKIN